MRITPNSFAAPAIRSLPVLLAAFALLPLPAAAEYRQETNESKIAHSPKRGGGFIELSLGATGIVYEEEGDRTRGNQFGLHGGYMFNSIVGVRAGARNFAGEFTSYDIGSALVFGGAHSAYINLGVSFLDIGDSGYHLETGYRFEHSSGFTMKVGYNFYREFGGYRRLDSDERSERDELRDLGRRDNNRRGDDDYRRYRDRRYDYEYIGNFAGGFGLSFGYGF